MDIQEKDRQSRRFELNHVIESGVNRLKLLTPYGYKLIGEASKWGVGLDMQT